MTSRSLSQQKLSAKPVKPSPDYPLYAHASGKWCKKIRGKAHYFGTWDEPDVALQEWLAVKEDLLGGADPNRNADRPMLRNLANAFLVAKQQKLDAGDLSKRAWDDYHEACERFLGFIGKTRFIDTLSVDDFARYRASFPDTWGPSRINNEIARLSTVLNYAYQNELVEAPIRTGENFKRVSQKKQRLERAKKPKKLFTAIEIHQLLNAANFQLKAMILLGINCGYGNADCGRLTIPMIDFRKSWLEGLREKTAIERAAFLWPETKTAVREAINQRYGNAPESLADRVFITKRRQSWFNEDGSHDPLSAAFCKLTTAAGCRRQGVGFYALRHTFETIAGDSKDQIAVNYVMGHCDASMADVYREGIDPRRIKDVCNHVRKWWQKGKPKKKGGK
jgi:integrase